VVVSSIYWSLILFWPAGILLRIPNSNVDNAALFRLTLPVDLALHASPVLALVTDFVLFETRYGVNAVASAPYIISLFAIWYGSWVEHCARGNNDICMFRWFKIGQWM
jgi:FAR-17a/AIG1-like protein